MIADSDARRASRAPLVVAAVSFAIGSFFAFNALRVSGFDPAIFLAFGDRAAGEISYAEERLGRTVPTRPGGGHDGKTFFIQANDPLYLNPSQHGVFIDEPRYRAQRMLYPLLAGVLGGFQPTWILWSMLAINVALFGVGGWITSRLAEAMGVSPWLGFAFVANLGVLFEWFISGSGVLAFTLALAATWAMSRQRAGQAVALFALAVLAREVMLLYVAGVGLLTWLRFGRRSALTVVLVPTISMLAWAAYLRLRLPDSGSVDAVGALGVPFEGMSAAFDSWVAHPIDGLTALVYLAVLTAVGIRAWRTPTYLGWGTAPFLMLAIVLSEGVWGRMFDFSRVLIPTTTAFLLANLRRPVEVSADR